MERREPRYLGRNLGSTHRNGSEMLSVKTVIVASVAARYLRGRKLKISGVMLGH